MIHRTMIFNKVDLVEDLGLHYSSFEEKLPEPKTSYVEIVAGSDIDLTEANGNVSYGDGEHTLVFLSLAETEEERLGTRDKVLTLTNGRKAQYVLDWKGEAEFTGRCTTEVKHLTPLADLFTMTIRHSPYRSINEQLKHSLDERTMVESVNATTNKLRLTLDMSAPAMYTNLMVRVYRAARARYHGVNETGYVYDIDSGYVDCSTTGNTTLIQSSTKVTVAEKGFVLLVEFESENWWYAMPDEEAGDAMLSTSHATIDGDTVTLDDSWSLDADNYVSPNNDVRVWWTRRAF